MALVGQGGEKNQRGEFRCMHIYQIMGKRVSAVGKLETPETWTTGMIPRVMVKIVERDPHSPNILRGGIFLRSAESVILQITWALPLIMGDAACEQSTTHLDLYSVSVVIRQTENADLVVPFHLDPDCCCDRMK